MVCWFSSFWHHFDLVKQVKFGVSGDFLQNAWEEWNLKEGLKFNMQMCRDCISNCVHFGHGLLIFLILTVFWLSETSQICSSWAFSGEYIAGIAWTDLVISEEMEKKHFKHTKSIQSPSGGYPWLLCSQTYLVMFIFLSALQVCVFILPFYHTTLILSCCDTLL